MMSERAQAFPGVPLLLARPDLSMTLLDALQKRIRFLQDALALLAVQAECVHGRVEDFARLHRETYDVALSRAVAPLPILLEWLLPLVRVGGGASFGKALPPRRRWRTLRASARC